MTEAQEPEASAAVCARCARAFNDEHPAVKYDEVYVCASCAEFLSAIALAQREQGLYFGA